MTTAPWSSEAKGRVHHFSMDDNNQKFKRLSKSDTSALHDALTTILSLDFGQIRKITHEDRAYVSAWKDEEDISAFPMNMALLLDEEDEAAIEDVRYLAEMTSI